MVIELDKCFGNRTYCCNSFGILKKAKENEILTPEKLKEIYDDPFQEWAYGPVVRGQYNRFKNFGCFLKISRNFDFFEFDCNFPTRT